MDNKAKEEKKDFHFLNEDITNAFIQYRDDPEYQTNAIRISDIIDDARDDKVFDKDDLVIDNGNKD